MLLLASLAHAAPVCRPTRRFTAAQVWTGTFGGSTMTWCLSNALSMLPFYEEIIYGQASCRGRECPLRRARFGGTLTNEDLTPQPGREPHGILDLDAGWGRHCAVKGTTQVDPPIVQDRVGGTIAATLSCRHGRRMLPTIRVDVTRVQ